MEKDKIDAKLQFKRGFEYTSQIYVRIANNSNSEMIIKSPTLMVDREPWYLKDYFYTDEGYTIKIPPQESTLVSYDTGPMNKIGYCDNYSQGWLFFVWNNQEYKLYFDTNGTTGLEIFD